MNNFSEAEVAACKAFLSNAKILIVEDELGGRLALKSSLSSFGASPTQIKLSVNLAQARTEIERSPPNIIFANFTLDDGFGSTLLEDSPNSIFILISQENSKAVLGHAVEVGIEHFMFRPYERDHLNSVLYTSIHKHLNPPAGTKQLELGKVNLRNGRTDEALRIFTDLKKVNHSAAENFAWIGQCLEEMGKPAREIEEAYSNGLMRSPNHFKCLDGLYRTFKNSQRLPESYLCLKKLVLLYPENAERVNEAVELALKTRNFQDLEIYGDIFYKLQARTTLLENSLASAFSVVGTLFLSQKERELAIHYYRRALEITSSKDKFVEYACEHLRAEGFGNDANDFHALFHGFSENSDRSSA